MNARERRRERLIIVLEGVMYMLVLIGVFAYIASLQGVQP